MELKIYDTKEAVAAHFSNYLFQFIETRPAVHIALSGGSTPKIIFDRLTRDYATKIDWPKVYLYWGDERCVPPDHEDSNYKMTVDHLMSKIEIPPSNIHRIRGENDPKEEALAYGAVLANGLSQTNGIPQFDLVFLGLGDDGHTASIFPHNIHLWESESNCEVAEHPVSGQKRITITGKIINNARYVAFLVTGSSKADKVWEIIKKEGDFKKYPASLVQPKSKNLIWFLDKEAANGLTSIQP